MILAISLPCWLIPVLTGLISALLGYLLGRSAIKEWKDKALKFEADLNDCKKNRIKLESDLKVASAITNNSTTFDDERTSLNAEINNWKNKVLELETKLVSCDNCADDVIESWKTRVSSLEANLKSNHDTKLRLESDLNALKEKANDDSASFKNKISELEKALTESKTQASLSASEFSPQKLSDDAQLWKKRVGDLQNELISTKTKKADLKRELEELKEATSNSEDTTELKNKIASLEEELRNAKASIAPTIQNTSSITSSLAGASIEFDANEAKAVFGKKIKQDDLTVVEGIGPKIQGLFHDHGVKTWLALSQCSIEKCQEVLESGGSRYRMHNPSTWPKQAGFAAEGKWEELKIWQDELDGGR